MADLSLLPEELLRLVLDKLSSPRDNARSSAVCKLWHSIYKKKIFPWLMLTDHDLGNHARDFFSLYDHQVYRINLPELEDKFVCGSSHGWLITFGFDHVLRLLDPFSRTQIQLPPPPKQKEYLEYVTKEMLRDVHMHKVIMSCDPRTNPGDCIIMAILDTERELAYCRLGGKTWISFPSMRRQFFSDIYFYKGKFYAVSGEQVFVCDIDDPKARVTAFGPKISPEVRLRYLVALAGELLLLERYRYIGSAERCTRFDFYKLDPGMSTWTKVKDKDMGDEALFIGINNFLALTTSSFPGCNGNSIYFGDVVGSMFLYGRNDIGIFLLKDGRSETLYPRSVFDNQSPYSPMWLIRDISNGQED